MPFLQKADEKFAELHGGGLLPLISPEKAQAASEYYAAKEKETGNFLYGMLVGGTSFVAEHFQETAMFLATVRGRGAASSLESKEAAALAKSEMLGPMVCKLQVRGSGEGLVRSVWMLKIPTLANAQVSSTIKTILATSICTIQRKIRS